MNNKNWPLLKSKFIYYILYNKIIEEIKKTKEINIKVIQSNKIT